jgi:hypothetical protein
MPNRQSRREATMTGDRDQWRARAYLSRNLSRTQVQSLNGVAMLSPHQAWAPSCHPSGLCPERTLFVHEIQIS